MNAIFIIFLGRIVFIPYKNYPNESKVNKNYDENLNIQSTALFEG